LEQLQAPHVCVGSAVKIFSGTLGGQVVATVTQIEGSQVTVTYGGLTKTGTLEQLQAPQTISAPGALIVAPIGRGPPDDKFTFDIWKASVPLTGGAGGDEAFCTSNFHRHIKNAPKFVSEEQVRYHLKQAYGDAAAVKFLQAKFRTVAEKAAWLWTLEVPDVYKKLNNAIIEDVDRRLEEWAWFIRALNLFAVGKPDPQKMRLYRGSVMSKEDFDKIKKGMSYRLKMVVAMSEEEAVARKFMARKESEGQGPAYFVTFKAPANCWNLSPLLDKNLSASPQEKERLLPPYTVVTCTEKNEKERKLVYEIAPDNAAVAMTAGHAYA